jgi:hypothetical protein
VRLGDDLARRLEPVSVFCNHERASSAISWVPATIAISAVYRADDGHRFYREVRAFDGRTPLVIGKRGLEPADWASNFEGLVESDDPPLAAIPGGGWMVKHRGDDGTEWVSPVLAWTIDRYGRCTPVCTDGEGFAEPDPLSASVFFHADERETPAA